VSDDKVVTLTVRTKLDLPPERILRGAIEKDLDGCFVIGRDKDGDLYFASSIADGGDILWLWEKAKTLLMEAD
jgi:hypothetical protein